MMNMKSILKTVYLVIVLAVFSLIINKYVHDNNIEFIPHIEYSDSRDIYYTDYMALEGGDYGVTICYSALDDTEITMFTDNTDSGSSVVLDKNEKEFFYELHLDEYNDLIHFEYSVNAPEVFTLEKIQIESKKPIFRDYLFGGLIFIVIAIYALVHYSSDSFWHKPLSEKAWEIIVILSLVVTSLPLFCESLFWGADAPAHVMRLEGVKDALLNRQVPVYIFPKSANGYGLLGYLYPNLFLYIPALTRIAGISIPFTMNALYIFINVLTAALAYIGAGAFYEKKEARYLFTVLYVLLPYRLVNIYTRADLGEVVVMSFLPLVFAGLYVCVSDRSLWNEKKGIAALTIGMTGVIHSHVLSSAMICGVAFVYALIFIRNVIKREKIKIVLSSMSWTVLLNIGYIVPFIKFYLFGLNFDVELDRGVIFEGKYSLAELFRIHDFSNGTAWGGVSIIGVIGIILFILGVVIGLKNREINSFMIVSGIIAVVLIISNGGEFPWYRFKEIEVVSAVMRVFEFSFRVMLISAPLLAIVMTYYIYTLKADDSVRTVLAVAVAMIAFISVIPGIIGETKSEPFISRLGGGASDTILREYLPEGVTPGVYSEDRLFWSSEDLIFDKYVKDGLQVDFDYATTGTDDEWLAPPVLYYPGYKAVAVTSSGEKYELGVSQGDYFRTRIDLPVSLSGSHVKMYFAGKWYFNIAHAISLMSLAVFTFIIIKEVIMTKREVDGI